MIPCIHAHTPYLSHILKLDSLPMIRENISESALQISPFESR